MKDLDLKKLFMKTKTIAIVGLSDKRSRTSNRIAHYLQEAGFRIVPVNPNVEEILGEKCYNSLSDIPKDLNVDIVNVFRRSEFLPELAKETVECGFPFFWAQLGVYNKEAMDILDKASIPNIMDLCIMVEHQRLFF